MSSPRESVGGGGTALGRGGAQDRGRGGEDHHGTIRTVGGCSVRITFALIVAGPSLARLLEPHLRCASESGPLYTVGRILASLAVSVPMPTRTSTHSAASRTCTLCRVPLSLQPDRGEPARGRLHRAICNCIMFVGWETISRSGGW